MRMGRLSGVGGVGIAIAALAGLATAQDPLGIDVLDERRIEPTAQSRGLWCFTPGRRAAQADFERALHDAIEPSMIRSFHDRLASEPHPAASEGDRRVIAFISRAFEEMGLEVEVQWIDVYLAKPVRGEVEIVRRGGEEVSQTLPTMEEQVDAFSGDPRLDPGWNAFSGSGEVTAEVVYANYGTREDFRRLEELGVDCDGKIVIARYGGNYRGYKAKFAEEAGAAGLIMYSDPENVGYVRGLMYPDGGWANETQIQRGSIKTLGYAGDPLTPGEPAIDGVGRLDPARLALPRIPVQPLGWAAAEPILRAMEGRVVPEEWQGGLPLNYRLEGGEGLRVRLRVEQERGIMRTANVVGVLRGAREPERTIVVGCHHDAWTHGAGDPAAGLMLVMELARTFGELASEGRRPDRTICFAAWGAEEYGIIGSTEWVERHAPELSRNCIAYMNLDMAAMGTRFGASASPFLRPLIADATRDVEQIDTPGTTVYEAWDGRNDGRSPEQQIGSLGGGSDHVGFNCHLGIPCVSMGAWGSRGVSYHSAYDNLAWYRQVVGEDYEPAAMMTRIAQLALARLANADVIPYDVPSFAAQFGADLDGIEGRASALGKAVPEAPALRAALERMRTIGERLRPTVDLVFHERRAPDGTLAEINANLLELSRAWSRATGLPERPWYRNLLIATDPDAGYGSWALPELRYYVERADDPSGTHEALTREYAAIVDRWARELEATTLRGTDRPPTQADRP